MISYFRLSILINYYTSLPFCQFLVVKFEVVKSLQNIFIGTISGILPPFYSEGTKKISYTGKRLTLNGDDKIPVIILTCFLKRPGVDLH